MKKVQIKEAGIVLFCYLWIPWLFTYRTTLLPSNRYQDKTKKFQFRDNIKLLRTGGKYGINKAKSYCKPNPSLHTMAEKNDNKLY